MPAIPQFRNTLDPFIPLIPDLSDKAKNVFYVIAARAFKYRDCRHVDSFPGESRIAEDLGGVSVRTVQRAINELCAGGWLLVQRRGTGRDRAGRTNRYIINTEKLYAHAEATHARLFGSPKAAATDATDLSCQSSTDATDLSCQSTTDATDLSCKQFEDSGELFEVKNSNSTRNAAAAILEEFNAVKPEGTEELTPNARISRIIAECEALGLDHIGARMASLYAAQRFGRGVNSPMAVFVSTIATSKAIKAAGIGETIHKKLAALERQRRFDAILGDPDLDDIDLSEFAGIRTANSYDPTPWLTANKIPTGVRELNPDIVRIAEEAASPALREKASAELDRLEAEERAREEEARAEKERRAIVREAFELAVTPETVPSSGVRLALRGIAGISTLYDDGYMTPGFMTVLYARFQRKHPSVREGWPRDDEREALRELLFDEDLRREYDASREAVPA